MAEDITAFAQIVLFAALFGARFLVVVAFTQRGKTIEGRERLCGQTLFPAAL